MMHQVLRVKEALLIIQKALLQAELEKIFRDAPGRAVNAVKASRYYPLIQ
jgi:hypothetical protein